MILQKATPRGAELGARFGVEMVGWGGANGASSVITGISPFIEKKNHHLIYFYLYTIHRVSLERIGRRSFCL